MPTRLLAFGYYSIIPPARPLTERVLLHLLRCGSQARPPARTLADALDCSGRRYPDLRAVFDDLLDVGRIDHGQRLGTTRRKDCGYALTGEGRARAEALRAQCVTVTVSRHPWGRAETVTMSLSRSESRGRGNTLLRPLPAQTDDLTRAPHRDRRPKHGQQWWATLKTRAFLHLGALPV